MAEDNSIDTAIVRCEEIIKTYKVRSTFILCMIAFLLFAFVSFVYLQIQAYRSTPNLTDLKNKIAYVTNLGRYTRSLDSLKLVAANNFTGESQPDKTLFYILYGISIALIGILTSFYRLQLSEIAKNEHVLVGFLRIRIAGNNSDEKFETEVRRSLTENAFLYLPQKTLAKGKVESPIPGHPASDLVTQVLNKLLDNVEIKPKS